MIAAGNWSFPTGIRFGPGRVRELTGICRERGIARPLLVTDRGTARLPFVAQVRQQLAAEFPGTGLFPDVEPNPTTTNVERGADAFVDGRHDGVVALGGGSGIDAGKAIGFVAGQAKGIEEFVAAPEAQASADLSRIAPVIAVPTTAGTGSEVGRSCVLTSHASGAKRILAHPRIMPAAVVLDPELTAGLPRNLTAATGLDAFTHCFEAYCAPGWHPMADAIALEGMRMIARALPATFRDGKDIEARGVMLAAATMGAVAFQKGLGAVHAVSHAVGAVYGSHHGLTNAVFLPYVIVRNRSAISEPLARIATTLSLENTSVDGFLEWILALREQLDIPNGAAALGVRGEDIPRLAELAQRDPVLADNPLPLVASDLEQVLHNALQEKL